MKLSKTNSRHCKRRLTWYVKHEYTLYRTSSLFTYCIIWWMPRGPMASPWLWGVIAIATWWSWWWWSAPWEGPVQSSCYRASCSSTGYAGRTKGRKEMALCIAGIVGTGLTLRGAHMVLPWSDRVLALVCFVCGCIKRRHGNSVG